MQLSQPPLVKKTNYKLLKVPYMQLFSNTAMKPLILVSWRESPVSPLLDSGQAGDYLSQKSVMEVMLCHFLKKCFFNYS